MIDVQLALSEISKAETESFNDLVDITRLDRTSDFVGADLTNMVFNGETLDGYDFSGADFRGSTFVNTVISRSNLKGAKFDKHVSIDIEGGIVISAIDPDFDALSSLVFEYNNQPLAKDREFCLRSLVQRFNEKPGVISFVRRSAANDRAYSVPKSVTKYLSIYDNEFDKFRFMIQILRGDNSSRHEDRAFTEAWNSAGDSVDAIDFLQFYASDKYSLTARVIHLCDDRQLDSFMSLVTNHLRSEALSSRRRDISYALISLGREKRVNKQFDKLIDLLIEDHESKVGLEVSPIWQLSTVVKAARSENLAALRDALKQVLQSSSTIHNSIPAIVPPSLINDAGLHNDIWDWVIMRYEPDADERRYWLFDLYEWMRVPFQYFDISDQLRDALRIARIHASSVKDAEAEIAERLSGHRHSDILDVMKRQLFFQDEREENNG